MKVSVVFMLFQSHIQTRCFSSCTWHTFGIEYSIKSTHMQEKELQEDQFHVDRDVQNESQANRDMQDNPVSDSGRDKNTDPAAIYSTLDSTLQTPEEHRKDQRNDPRKEDSKITGTSSYDETGAYPDKGVTGL